MLSVIKPLAIVKVAVLPSPVNEYVVAEKGKPVPG
jgi:hypothetical protein